MTYGASAIATRPAGLPVQSTRAVCEKRRQTGVQSVSFFVIAYAELSSNWVTLGETVNYIVAAIMDRTTTLAVAAAANGSASFLTGRCGVPCTPWLLAAAAGASVDSCIKLIAANACARWQLLRPPACRLRAASGPASPTDRPISITTQQRLYCIYACLRRYRPRK